MINLKFTNEQLALLNKALLLLPYGEVTPLIGAINDQIQKSFDIAADKSSE